ncbi:MAG TPA: hypothetical protein DCQ34_09700 [Chitinophagaceae bacterium]|nr:hypothetical protein [Chitinophagaceae bacterium]HCY90284.1 hypothetical protein [Chitinophagaceae bacterium]HRF27762.1 hypothetical protein [Ferruginibacter sp.]
MLEILALIFLTKKIGDMASRKGIKPMPWKIFTIVAWIAFEFLGIMLAAIMFGNQNLFAIISIGILSAFGGYLLVRAILEKQPDRIDEDIDRIGSNDLRP